MKFVIVNNTSNIQNFSSSSEIHRLIRSFWREYIRPGQRLYLWRGFVLGSAEVPGTRLARTSEYQTGIARVLLCVSHLWNGHQHDSGRERPRGQDPQQSAAVTVQSLLDHQQDVQGAAVPSRGCQRQTPGRLQRRYPLLLQEEDSVPQEQGETAESQTFYLEEHWGAAVRMTMVRSKDREEGSRTEEGTLRAGSSQKRTTEFNWTLMTKLLLDFVPDPVVCLHQLLVWWLLSWHRWELRLRPLPRPELGLSGKSFIAGVVGVELVGMSLWIRLMNDVRVVQVGISIGMSSFNLTRIVTMSPFYTLVNKSSYELEVGEVSQHTSVRWHYVASTEVKTIQSFLLVSIYSTLCCGVTDPCCRCSVCLCGQRTSRRGCASVWLALILPPTCSSLTARTAARCWVWTWWVRLVYAPRCCWTVCWTDMFVCLFVCLQCGGIIVDVSVSDHSTVVSFNNYYEGAAPALMVNHTPWVTIKYRQRSETQVPPTSMSRFFFLKY